MSEPSSKRILVLNRLWQPVNIVGVKRGFSLLMQEHAQAIDTASGAFQILDAEEWIAYSVQHPPVRDCDSVQTIRMRIRIPSVLLLRVFDRVPSKEVKFNRRSIFERDGFVCQYCGVPHGESDLNLDHVIPRDQGGKTSWENIVTSCLRCNTRKANRMPHQAGMRLHKMPERPRWRPFVSVVNASQPDPEWHYFLNK